MSSIFAVVLSLTHAQSTPSIPTLPEQYQTVVTCNIVNKNYTVQIKEVYDLPRDRGFVTRIHPDDAGLRNPNDPDHGRTYDLYLYDLNERLHVNDSGCYGHFTNDTSQRGGFCGPSGDGHLPSTRACFGLGAGWNESYIGQRTINGIPCNHWKSENKTQYANFTVDLYFSIPEWKIPTANWSEVPVMLNLSGTMCNFGPFGPNCTAPRYIEHAYMYSDFHVGLSDDDAADLFAVDPDANCTGNYTIIPRRAVEQCNETEDEWSTIEEVETAFMVIGSFFAGAIIAVLIMMRVRNSSSSSTTHTSFNNDLSVNADDDDENSSSI